MFSFALGMDRQRRELFVRATAWASSRLITTGRARYSCSDRRSSFTEHPPYHLIDPGALAEYLAFGYLSDKGLFSQASSNSRRLCWLKVKADGVVKSSMGLPSKANRNEAVERLDRDAAGVWKNPSHELMSDVLWGFSQAAECSSAILRLLNGSRQERGEDFAVPYAEEQFSGCYTRVKWAESLELSITKYPSPV